MSRRHHLSVEPTVRTYRFLFEKPCARGLHPLDPQAARMGGAER